MVAVGTYPPPGPAVVHGQMAIVTLNIAIALSPVSIPLVCGITVKRPFADQTAGLLYVGDASADGSTNAYPLLAGESIFIPIDDVSKVYINGPQGGWVAYIGA